MTAPAANECAPSSAPSNARFDFDSVDQLHNTLKSLTVDEQRRLDAQNSRLIPAHKADQLEQQAQRHWDLFYKRNETRFFKDRHWTTREFDELLVADISSTADDQSDDRRPRRLLEVGCGVGNLIFPLVEAHPDDFHVFACDFSPRAVDFVRRNALFDAQRMCAFQCDITADPPVALAANVERSSLDIVTMVFVLSAIHPAKFGTVLANVFGRLRPGGVLLLRDYGRYDMAQLRFKPGHKIADNLYARQDGTRSYYFTDAELGALAEAAGFRVQSNGYVHRRTVNVKEQVDAERIFVQAKFVRPE